MESHIPYRTARPHRRIHGMGKRAFHATDKAGQAVHVTQLDHPVPVIGHQNPAEKARASPYVLRLQGQGGRARRVPVEESLPARHRHEGDKVNAPGFAGTPDSQGGFSAGWIAHVDHAQRMGVYVDVENGRLSRRRVGNPPFDAERRYAVGIPRRKRLVGNGFSRDALAVQPRKERASRLKAFPTGRDALAVQPRKEKASHLKAFPTGRDALAVQPRKEKASRLKAFPTGRDALAVQPRKERASRLKAFPTGRDALAVQPRKEKASRLKAFPTGRDALAVQPRKERASRMTAFPTGRDALVVQPQ